MIAVKMEGRIQDINLEVELLDLAVRFCVC